MMDDFLLDAWALMQQFKLDAKRGSKTESKAKISVGKRKGYDPSQERGENGRWIKVNISKKLAERESGRNRREDPYPEATAQSRLSTETIYRYNLIDEKQKQVGIVAKPKPEPETKSEDTKAKQQKTPDPAVTQKKKRLPTLRKVVKKDSLEISKEGRVEIWRNSNDKKHDPTFKVKQNKDFEYKVEHEGKEIVLNRHKKGMEVLGERVDGVPSYYPNLRQMKDEQLFNGLARTMSFVEDKQNSPPAPDWKSTYHGKVDKDLLRSGSKPGEYGKMQLHHVHQWSEGEFAKISQEHKEGKISTDEAKSKMRDLLQPDPDNKLNGYAIKLARPEDRKLVILPEGAHAVPSPLYQANHPKGMHPDTGQLKHFGIPKEGDGGRNWVNNTFRPTFWREYYRTYSFVAVNEINRRVADAGLTVERTKALWDDSVSRANASFEYIKQLREERDKS